MPVPLEATPIRPATSTIALPMDSSRIPSQRSMVRMQNVAEVLVFVTSAFLASAWSRVSYARIVETPDKLSEAWL